MTRIALRSDYTSLILRQLKMADIMAENRFTLNGGEWRAVTNSSFFSLRPIYQGIGLADLYHSS